MCILTHELLQVRVQIFAQPQVIIIRIIIMCVRTYIIPHLSMFSHKPTENQLSIINYPPIPVSTNLLLSRFKNAIWFYPFNFLTNIFRVVTIHRYVSYWDHHASFSNHIVSINRLDSFILLRTLPLFLSQLLEWLADIHILLLLLVGHNLELFP